MNLKLQKDRGWVRSVILPEAGQVFPRTIELVQVLHMQTAYRSGEFIRRVTTLVPPLAESCYGHMEF